jgi:hypothetical protein
MSEKIDNVHLEGSRSDNPASTKRLRGMSHGLRLAIFSSALALPLAFFLALKPTSARVVWEEFARMIELKGNGRIAHPGKLAATMNVNLAALPPQTQAELVLEETVSDYESAGVRLSSRMGGWRGRLTMSPRLANLLDSGLNSPHLRRRSAAS